MNAFGSKVTLAEMLPHILPSEDEDVVAVLDRSFRERGIDILTSTKVVSRKSLPDGSTEVVFEGPHPMKNGVFDVVLVVTGRIPNTEGIGLESVGIKTDRGFIPVGDYGMTGSAGIYAIGDVVATPLLAHVASAEGELAVEHIAGLDTHTRVDPLDIPMAVYTEPQVASFGINEAAAKKAGIPYATARFPFRGIGKAVAIEAFDGFAKAVYDPESLEILGAQIVGPEATEIIHELLLARKAELFPADVTSAVHAHPTLSEIVLELMRAVQGHPIHV
jgi:dihydrolipoamide dehydrogenase